MARLLCLYDEGAQIDTPLIGAKGTSFLVDSEDRRVLFDTGLRDRYLLHNMEQLDIDPDSIDVIAVSQGVPDNGRALDGLLRARTRPVDVYAPDGMYDGKQGFMSGRIGLSEEARTMATIYPIEGWTELAPKVWLTPRLVASDGYMEAFLVVEGRQLTVVSGRGYDGPALPLAAAEQRFSRKPRAFVGSVRLEGRRKSEGRLIAADYASQFDQFGCLDLHLNHCTGREGMTWLRTKFGLKGVNDFYAGMSLELRTT